MTCPPTLMRKEPRAADPWPLDLLAAIWEEPAKTPACPCKLQGLGEMKRRTKLGEETTAGPGCATFLQARSTTVNRGRRPVSTQAYGRVVEPRRVIPSKQNALSVEEPGIS